MTLEPLLTAPPAVKLHVVTVVPAFVIGTWLILLSRKGRRPHRALGMLYLVLMTVTAIASLFIQEVNPGGLSLIHLFVPLTLFGVVSGLRSARRGDVVGHRQAMIGVYIGGLLIAGALTFLPGRLMHALFLG